MSKPSPNDAEWEHVRRLWETTPKMTFGDAGRMLGVSRQAVYQRSSREGWKKDADLSAISRRAHAEADAVEQAALIDKGLRDIARDPSRQAQAQAAVKDAVRETAEQLKQEARDQAEKTAVEIRTKLIAQHRKEWLGVRAIIWEAINKRDFDIAKLGKIVSEATRIVQDGERKSYGLDVEEKKDGGAPGEPVRLIIERREMKL